MSDHERKPDVDIDDILTTSDTALDHEALLSDLTALTSDDYYQTQLEAPMIGDGIFANNHKKKKKKEETKDAESSSIGEDDWFSAFMDKMDKMDMVASGSSMRKRKSYYDAEDDPFFGTKKKKKKKKKKGQPTDFRKEFEPENQLFTNILRDTTRFIDTLQREYDVITSKKGTGRGTTKNTQDLVANINSARQLAMSLVEKKVNLKKLATELSFKERKELGLGDAAGTDLGEYGSAYLKKLLDERQSIFNGGREDIMDLGDEVDSEEVYHTVDNLLSENLEKPMSDEEQSLYGKTDRTDEADLYLKYENQNVRVHVRINPSDTEEYEYFAVDEDGNEIDDYPLPVSRIASINRSTGIATDEFGQKYYIEWS